METKTKKAAKKICVSMEFADAQEMHKNHQLIFIPPSKEELSELKIGDIVTVFCLDYQEQYCVTITSINGKKITGKIISILITSLVDDFINIQEGDIIEFEKRHIYKCVTVKEGDTVQVKIDSRLLKEVPRKRNFNNKVGKVQSVDKEGSIAFVKFPDGTVECFSTDLVHLKKIKKGE